MQMGVKVDRIEQTFEPPPSTRLTKTSIPPATLWGERRASYYVIDGRGNGASIAINRLEAAGLDVGWVTSPLDVQGYSYNRGAIVVSENAKDQARPLVENIASSLGLRATGIRGALPPAMSRLAKPRIGLYKPWVENIDEGWTRFLLEQYEFPFESLNDQQIRAGGLRTRFDAIIIPDQSADRLMNGHAKGTMPPEYTGGLGSEGAQALKQFVEEGGTLIALDSATELAITALGLPVENVVRNARPEQFFVPGSILRLTLEETQPLNYGMPAETAAVFAFSSAFDVHAAPPSGGGTATPAPPPRVLARYATNALLMSGWLEGGDRIAGHGAVVEAQSGQGRAILIGFRAQHRAQSHATFRLLFNALHTAARPLPRTGSGTR
jgi:hypothetical protein